MYLMQYRLGFYDVMEMPLMWDSPSEYGEPHLDLITSLPQGAAPSFHLSVKAQHLAAGLFRLI